MKHTIVMAIWIAYCLQVMACDKDPGTASDPVHMVQEDTVAKPSPPAKAGAAEVEVPAEGRTFDPPVAIAQIPPGAWYCDMGTAHYARQNQGDGVCPVCSMALKKKE